MKINRTTVRCSSVRAIGAWAASIALCIGGDAFHTASASIAYGSIKNFDTVNDTGQECHGFEIELDDCHSTDITYTYNYIHYGVPEITEDGADPARPKVFIRWKSKKNGGGTWAAYTAIPSGPIAPTDGHMFTNPAVNFGGEHFGVGYTVQPSAVRYHWLVGNGSGVLVHGGAVQVSTPTFTYYPPAGGAPAQVQAVIAPPPPPAPPPKELGKAVWVKEIKTTTHDENKVKLRELVSDDPDNPNDRNWKNGEPDEVEVEWQIPQKKTSAADGGPNNEVPAAAEDLPNGNEVVTRRYEFYKYTGPLDAATGEAMGDLVGPDGSHGQGTVTYADHFDAATGEWVTVTTDMSTKVVVGDFTGSQTAAVDVDAAVALVDQVSEGTINMPCTLRTVVVQGALMFWSVLDGVLPAGMTFDDQTGVLSGTPTVSGEFQFKITASDDVNPKVSKTYTLRIAAAGQALAPKSLLDTTSSPVDAGATTGDGSYAVDANADATATPAAGFAFASWTDNGQIVSTDPNYTLVMDVNHSLVANFVSAWTIATSTQPAFGGATSGGGTVSDGATVVATANAGYSFVNWTEDGVEVSRPASYTFTASGDRDLVANFTTGIVISSSASPAAGGSTSGGGAVAVGSSVTVVATANAGYVFVNWTENGAQVGANAIYTFMAGVNRALVANFALAPSYAVTTSSNPSAGGSTAGAGTYASGASATLIATANVGCSFVNWTVGGTQVSTSAAYSFTVTANRALVANFIVVGGTPRTVVTSSSPAAGGSTTGAGTYVNGTSASVVATANPGYIFSKWKEGGSTVTSSASYTFTVTADRTLVASFTQAYTITALASPVVGGRTEVDSSSYKQGEAAQARAFPNFGYNFVNWTENGVDVSTQSAYTFNATSDRALVASFTLASGGVQFDFDTGATHVALGQTVPFDQMSAGIAAHFTATSSDAFTVGDAASMAQIVTSFSGKYLTPDAGGTSLDIAFDQVVAGISAKFALSEPLNLGTHSTLKLTAFDNSSGAPVQVGSATAEGAVVTGDTLASGTLSFSAGVMFDSVRIEILTAAQAGARFYCDNIAVTPNSAGGWQVLANPNWNITLTDGGYADYLIDNTPGIEGREYLCGEWGAAVAYSAGGNARSPRWMEPNLAFPDWTTNSNFHVVTPVSLIASSADGLPITLFVISNDEIEITIRSEMLDTVTGIPMGITGASAGGAGASVNSNRYVLNQTYTVKDVSGTTITNLQVFQMLHGFVPTRGVYDNRAYTGKFGEYRYDSTLVGVDAGTAGVDGSSSTGLQDYIGFSGKIAPSAFEIGHYGIEGNGIDDHVTGKPSDGVHLSIENNWGCAPYSTRLGTDSFAPADRWIAGAQRYDSDIEGVTTECTFFGEESEADFDEINDRIAGGDFVLPSFAEPGGLSQVWNLKYTGIYTGLIRLTFAYDPALLPVGFDQTHLTIYHYHGGAWEQLVALVDPVKHTITVTTTTLSPFMLGVPSADAIPKMAQTTAPAGQVEFNWSSDTSGWVLQESTDLMHWVNSARPVSTVGVVSSVGASTAEGKCFFRLAHSWT